MDSLDNSMIHILSKKKQCNVRVLPVTHNSSQFKHINCLLICNFLFSVYRLTSGEADCGIWSKIKGGLQCSGFWGSVLLVLQQVCVQSSVGWETNLCSPDDRSMADPNHTALALRTRDPILLTWWSETYTVCSMCLAPVWCHPRPALSLGSGTVCRSHGT